MMATSRKLLPLVLLLLVSSLANSAGKPAQSQDAATTTAPVVRITSPPNNVLRVGVGMSQIAGTVEGTNITEVGVSIRRAGTNEEWSPSKKSGRFVSGPGGKWLKATLLENNWYAPGRGYTLPTLADLLPEGTDEMRYNIYAYAKDRAGRRSEEAMVTITVRR